MRKIPVIVIGALILAGAICQNPWLLGLAIIILVALPPSWDPAIRFKEWTLRNRRK